MRCSVRPGIQCAVAALLAATSYAALADQEVSDVVELSQKLNAMKYYDFSTLALDTLMQKNPSEMDRLVIQKASTFFASGKPEEMTAGEKLLATISPSSPSYPGTRFVLGESFYKKSDFPNAAKAFEEYFKYFSSPANLEKVKDDKAMTEQYKQGCMGYLKDIYTRLGDSAGVDRALKYYEPISGATGEDPDQIIINVQAKLDSVESLIANNKPGWQAIVDACQKKLEPLVWRGMDPVAAQAYVEQARCLVLSGQAQKALELLDRNEELIVPFTELFVEQRNKGWAPEGFATYWKGRAYLALAKTQKDKKLAEASYIDALKCFLKVIKKFTDNSTAPKAMVYLNESKGALETQFGKKINVGKLPAIQGAADSSPEEQQGDALSREKRYAQAAAKYLDAFPQHRDNAKLLAKLVVNFIQAGEPMKARAVAGYFADTFPEDDGAPFALLQVGQTYWDLADKAEKAKDPKSKDMADDAMAILDEYVFSYPSDQYAGAISTKLAGERFKRAREFGKEVNAMKDPQEKLKAKEQYKRMFLDCAPGFQRIIDNYANSPQFANIASYQLGWCYSNGGKNLEAAAAFLDFTKKEDRPKELPLVADAKLGAAQCFFQEADDARRKRTELLDQAAALPAASKDEAAKLQAEAQALLKPTVENYLAAVANIDELLNDWSKGRLAAAKGEKLTQSMSNAAVLLGWAYDGLAELATAENQAKYKQKAIAALQDFLAKYPKAKQVPAALSRIGTLYADLGEFDKSAATLDGLAANYPESPEGKKALFTLARSVYEIGQYQRAIDAVGKMFAKNTDLTVKNLRWIANSFVKFGEGTKPKAGKRAPTEVEIKAAAALALKADELLLADYDKADRVTEDWFGSDELATIRDESKDMAKEWQFKYERVLFLASQACNLMEDYKRSIDFLTKLLKNPKTPYYYTGLFLRGNANGKLKQYQQAFNDYGEIAAATDKMSLRFDASNKAGDLYLEMKDYPGAKMSFFVITVTPFGKLDGKVAEIKLMEELLDLDDKLKAETSVTKRSIFADKVKKIEDALVKGSQEELKAAVKDAAEYEKTLPPEVMEKVRGKQEAEKIKELAAYVQRAKDSGSKNGALPKSVLIADGYRQMLETLELVRDNVQERRRDVEARKYEPLKKSVAVTKFDTRAVMKKDAEELGLQRDNIEYALYKEALCASLMGPEQKEEMAKLVARYKQAFPSGKYIAEVGRLSSK